MVIRWSGVSKVNRSGKQSTSWGLASEVEVTFSGSVAMDDSKKRILIIEDDAEMRSLLKDVIEEEGYEAELVEKGTYAFRKVMTKSFAVIITDVRMRGVSGLDILPGLRKLQPETPIIVITAFGSEEVRRRALERGASAYMEKPIRLDELRTLIHKMVFLKHNRR